MTDKAYIVANEQQEREVLGILGANGLKYVIGTYSQFRPLTGFPYVIYEFNTSNFLKSGRVPKIKYSTDIIYDGRKEEHMSDKYVVSQEFMNELKEWKEFYITDTLEEKYHYVSAGDLDTLPGMIKDWWIGLNKPIEKNNRLIAIIRWVNGEDVFEVEKPKKWVVRSKETDSTYCYAQLLSENNNTLFMAYSFANATRFDTKEEADSWANAHQEVIEVGE